MARGEWQKAWKQKIEAGHIEAFYSTTGRKHKLVLYSADHAHQETKYLDGDGAIEFQLPSKTFSFTVETTDVKSKEPSHG